MCYKSFKNNFAIVLCHEKGKFLNYKCKLKIDENVRPIQQRLRRQPYHLRKAIKEKLESMEKDGLKCKVDSPQEWLSNIVVTPKSNGDIRICLDAREINKAIVRQKYLIPTVDSLIDEIGDSNVFSKIYLREAYAQIELDEESSKLTSFITEEGVYKFNRLIYGINDAGDIFQQCLQSKISDLHGVKCISDDIIVYSKNIHEHKALLSKLFKRLKAHGFKVNGSKCLIGKSTISFFGIIISSSGIRPDPEKVQYLSNANAPTNLSFFDPRKPITLWVDASNYAIGGILLQPDDEGHPKPVCYTSRALSQTEQKYSVTEKESLAVVHAVSKWHVYLYHAEFTVIVDHNPLKFILTSRTRATPRIERWCENIADYISRIRNNAPTGENITNEYANFITNNSVPHSMSLNEIRTASENDDEIQEIRKALTSDNWSSLQKYEFYKEEFCEVNGIILRRNRLFIPKSLVQKIMEIAHRSCLGIVKLKSLPRCKVYWYNMDRDIKNLIQSCPSCQKIGRHNKPTQHIVNNY
ncbi:uncharacterized protein K02A2.6-like [Hydractinia symbiolongicarpus]|uniref:uncharacterized protein K02A2.6-like n=1 Tax=Hydractinia symbiolongicarpus TaxID=13093 RepID=UPI0025513562|nr:uncharacterized protein K02A2.6-like [Hydractinia symbiolongicarpus]